MINKCCISFVLLLACWSGSARAKDASAPPLSKEALAAFFAQTVPRSLLHHHTPGAVVAVVVGEETRFLRGFGVSTLNAEQGSSPASSADAVPIRGEECLFRVASLSKVVTATAVMRLVVEGRLDLDKDVNAYLRAFQIQAAYPAPLTLRHLLTHTAGFDDRFLRMAARTPDDLRPLSEYLARNLPPRVMPPGGVMSYSNHGYALAGHLIECATGVPFADYMDDAIFAPLGMTHTAFHLVPNEKTPVAQGYRFVLGKYQKAIYDYPQTVPASSLATTGKDMARFLALHLCRGRLDGEQVIPEAVFDYMHTRQFGHHAALPGRTYGFSERKENGVRLLEHTGLIWGFTSLITLLPEKGVGLFVSCNSESRGVYADVRRRFLNHFFPFSENGTRQEKAAPNAPREASLPPSAYAGYYRGNRYCRGTLFKLGTMLPAFVSEAQIVVNDSGSLGLQWAGFKPKTTWYAKNESGCFGPLPGRVPTTAARAFARLPARNGPLLAFGIRGGETTHMFRGTSAYERIPWYVSWRFLVYVLAATLALLVSPLAVGPVRAVCRRKPPAGTGERRLRRLAMAVCALDLAFVAGLVAFLLLLPPNVTGYGPHPILVLVLTLPLIALPLTAVAVAGIVPAWRRRYWGRAARLHYTAVALAALVFLLLLHHWNLLGYRFG